MFTVSLVAGVLGKQLKEVVRKVGLCSKRLWFWGMVENGSSTWIGEEYKKNVQACQGL